MSDQKTILIADDEQLVRQLIRATLRNISLRILEAADGGEALALARRERPDLLLLDVGLPGVDGYAVCRALKSNPETAAITVIMLTARAQRKDQERGLGSGADAYLTKPFRPQELLQDVQKALAHG